MPYTLSQDDIDALARAAALVKDAQETAAKAARCGFDCAAHQAIADSLRERIDRIRQEFGPGKVRE